jgi:hypothetical protein
MPEDEFEVLNEAVTRVTRRQSDGRIFAEIWVPVDGSDGMTWAYYGAVKQGYPETTPAAPPPPA